MHRKWGNCISIGAMTIDITPIFCSITPFFRTRMLLHAITLVRVILRAMKAEGVIAPTGKGRGAKWSQVKAEGKT